MAHKELEELAGDIHEEIEYQLYYSLCYRLVLQLNQECMTPILVLLTNQWWIPLKNSEES